MAAALHFDLWVPNFGVQEYMGYSEQMLEVFPHNWTFDNGYMHPGDKPGLGIEFDEKLAAKYPRVIGHEFFGVIDAVGEGVESARVGERVAVDPVVSCGHCYPCSIGKPNVCTTLAVLGVHADGGFSEYAVVPAKNAWKIPEAVADQYAVMIEPFTIAANVTGHGQPTENDTVLVYG